MLCLTNTKHSMKVSWVNGTATVFFVQGLQTSASRPNLGLLPVIINKGFLGTQPLLLIYVLPVTLFML